jgi:hypothetical protein
MVQKAHFCAQTSLLVRFVPKVASSYLLEHNTFTSLLVPGEGQADVLLIFAVLPSAPVHPYRKILALIEVQGSGTRNPGER